MAITSARAVARADSSAGLYCCRSAVFWVATIPCSGLLSEDCSGERAASLPARKPWGETRRWTPPLTVSVM
ncbi:MAG: hypothetical protein U0835_00160 [Isosphaeraceae bacterium]